MEKLVEKFKESLFLSDSESEETIKVIKSKALDIGIDSVLDSGLIDEIPIIGTIYHFGKFAQNIHDRNLMRQTIAFIKEFHSGECNAESLQNYKDRLKIEPGFAEKELGRVLILLNKNIDIEKTQYMARFYLAYINKSFTWDVFCELCDIVDRMFLADVVLLRDIYYAEGVELHTSISYKHDRLLSNGLLQNLNRISGNLFMTATDSNNSPDEKLMVLTEIGKKFCQYAFENIDSRNKSIFSLS